jgi:NADH-quinone oxidoreductase subunit H
MQTLLQGGSNLRSSPVFWVIVAVIVLGILAAVLFGGGGQEKAEPEEQRGPFDAFAGGFPVPPKPGQVLPELAEVVATQSADETATSATAGPHDQQPANGAS